MPTAPVLEEAPKRKPAGINWRDTEAVTAIKNQGQVNQRRWKRAHLLPRSSASPARAPHSRRRLPPTLAVRLLLGLLRH